MGAIHHSFALMKILRIPGSLLLILPILAMWGCKNNSTSPNAPSTNSSSKVPPAPGSSFSTLWNGGYLQTAYDTVATTSITDPDHAGSKVIKLLETVSGQMDSTYESFEANGDVALRGTTWGATNVFESLPFVSQTTVNSSYVGDAGPVTISAVGSGAGKPFVLNGTSYPTDSVTVSVINSNDTDHFPYSYIPALGLICIENYLPGSPTNVPSTEWIIAYTPK